MVAMMQLHIPVDTENILLKNPYIQAQKIKSWMLSYAENCGIIQIIDFC